MSTALVIGPLTLEGFEVPASVWIGGRQRLNVHQLINGSRVVDALGPDEGDISWEGMFSGSEATIRFRVLETMRRSGVAIPLVWNGFAYMVVIERLVARYQGPYWISYRIACCVVTDAAAVLVGMAVSAGSQAVADIASAGSFGVETTALTSSLGSVPTVSSANAASVGAGISSTLASVNSELAAAAVNLQSSDFGTMAAAAQQSANLSIAVGYLSRAAMNVVQQQSGIG
jgi:hypothetical protein